MRILVTYSVVSWFDPVEGKGREMCRMDVQKIGQAPRRRHRSAVPVPHCQRSCGRRNGLQQGTGQQRQTDASLQRHFRPGAGHLQRRGILAHKEIGGCSSVVLTFKGLVLCQS